MKAKYKIGQLVCLNDINRLYRILEITFSQNCVWYRIDEIDNIYSYSEVTVSEKSVHRPPITELFKAGVNDMVAL